jgi:hypothetical protein
MSLDLDQGFLEENVLLQGTAEVLLSSLSTIHHPFIPPSLFLPYTIPGC